MGSCKKNILVLTYWSFKDALIQTYTLPYVHQIADTITDENKIILLTLEKEAENTFPLNKKIRVVGWLYKPLGIKAAWMWTKYIFKLVRIIRKEKIDTIHAWCTPAGMIGYILSVITGKELIIDSFEPHAETMVENGEWKKDSFAFKLLFRFEKLQAHRAKHLISISSKMCDYAKEKYGLSNKTLFIKPACVNLQLFSEKNIKNPELVKKLGLENKIVCVYAGKFGGIYLEKEAFDFFKVAENFWGNKFIALILTSNTEDEIEKYRVQSSLKKTSVIRHFVPHAEIANYIGLGDFAFTPVKPIPTKQYCSPIKDGEYWALGLPVVITKNISDDSDIINENGIGYVLEQLDEAEYLKAVHVIDSLLKNNSREILYAKIRNIAETKRNFSISKNIYNIIYR